MLYEVAILEMPSKKEAEEQGAIERLAFGPKPIVARDEQSAAVSVILDNPDIKVERARMRVLVRPFVKGS